MKILLLSITALFCLNNARAQTTAPAAKPAFKLVFEKTYLHTDRDVYAQGDTLYFKAYLLNAQDNTPANSSGNLHIELISPNAKVIKSELIRLEGGSGNGDFDFSDTIPPGKYHLRAYTNWMRNFGDNFIFDKEITVVGTGQKVAVAGKEVAGNDVGLAGKNKSTNASATATKSTSSIRFYPEGGSMVEGLNSIIAVKAEDASGKGVVTSGAVLSAGGDTIAHFACDTLGMGLFAMLPVKGQVYHAVVNGSNIALPSALSKGMGIQIRQTDSLIRVVVSSSEDPSALTVKPAYTLTIKHEGITLLNQPLQLAAQQTPLRIPTADLPPGIAAITLYDAGGKPNCERLVYIRPLNKANNAIISLSKKTYQPKEQVIVNINAKANANLSMAVVDAGVVPEQANDMVSYLTLGSEIRGNVEQAHRYFDTTNVNRYKQLDLLLMTQGWRDFVWRRLADTSIRISYAAEYNLHVQGKLTEKNNSKPLPGINVSLRADMAAGNKLLTTITDSIGRYNFNNLVQYGDAPVVVTARDDKGNDAGHITVDSAQLTLPNIRYYPASSIQQTYPLLEDRAAKQHASITKLKEIKIKAPNYIQLRDTRLTTMGYQDEVFTPGPADKQQTIRDYILYVSKQAKMENEAAAHAGKSGDQVRVNRMVFYADGESHDPRLIVDGYELPTNNFSSDDEIVKTNLYNQYFDLPLDKALKIIIKRGITPPRMGAAKHAGATISGSVGTVVLPGETVFVIYLTLKPGAMDAGRENVSQVPLKGYYQARTFYKPVINSKTTDLRSTLFWEPNIKTDATGKATINFNNSNATSGRVILQGVTDKGVPISVTTGYGVK